MATRIKLLREKCDFHREFNGKPNTLYLAFGQRATADVNIGEVGIIIGGSVITQKCGDVC